MEVIQYYNLKAHNYLYPDLIVDDLVQAVKNTIVKELSGFQEG